MKPVSLVKRRLLKFIALLPLVKVSTVSLAETSVINKIAFGSCLHQDKPQAIWNAVLAENPDLFIFLGDNIYGDSDKPEVLRQKYRKQAQNPGFQKLRASTEVIATWDDHDYGINDAGREFPIKEESRRLMLDFWGEPVESERRTRTDGIYTSYLYGPVGKRVQIILLDLRWNRTELSTVKNNSELQQRNKDQMGPYTANPKLDAKLLGEQQWQWLEQRFEEKAEVRIIGSSIQLLADFTGWETWQNFPKERERFMALLEKCQDSLNLIISGDVHWCELSRLEYKPECKPAVELTSSGLTETWEAISPNQNRLGKAYAVPNFGLLEFDWQGKEPVLKLSIKDEKSNLLIHHQHS